MTNNVSFRVFTIIENTYGLILECLFQLLRFSVVQNLNLKLRGQQERDTDKILSLVSSLCPTNEWRRELPSGLCSPDFTNKSGTPWVSIENGVSRTQLNPSSTNTPQTLGHPLDVDPDMTIDRNYDLFIIPNATWGLLVPRSLFMETRLALVF